MSEAPRKGYKYYEHTVVTAGTSEAVHHHTFLPDLIILINHDGTNAVQVAFDSKIDGTRYFEVPTQKTLKLPIQHRSVHYKSAAGTPKLSIIIAAREYKRIRG